MGWYAFISLVSDGRIKFLLGFIIVAIIIASILIFIEIRLKKEKEVKYVNTIFESIIEKIRKFLKNKKTPKEKLNFIDKLAKEYFKESYKTSLNSNYSELINKFKKLNKKNETIFLKKMFSVYYSHKKIDNNEIIVLGNLLIDIIKKDKLPIDKRKKILQEESNFIFNIRDLRTKTIDLLSNKIGNFLGGIKNFFDNRRNISIEKGTSNIKRMRIGKRENYKVIRRNVEEIKNWIKETIKIGYNKEEVFNLLNDGNRKKREINNILSVYDNEMSNISNNDENTKEKIIVKKNEGIAEKIVKMEKARLNNTGFYSSSK